MGAALDADLVTADARLGLAEDVDEGLTVAAHHIHRAFGRSVQTEGAFRAGPALGVHTEGLRWPLRGERLEPGTSRGVSNEMVAGVAEVSLDEGCLAVVVPQEEQP